MLRTLFLGLTICWLAAVESNAPQVEIRTSLGSITCRLFPAECPETVRTFCDLAEGRRAWKDPASGKEVTRPLYDGLTFHRVIPGFMIQGGDPMGDGRGGPGFSFKDEINAGSLGLDKQLVIQGQGMNPQCGYMMAQFIQAFMEPRFAAHGATTREQRQDALPKVLDELKDVTLQRFYEQLGYVYDSTLPPSHRPVKGMLAMANSGPATNGSQFFILVGDAQHLTGKHTIFGEVVDGQAVADAIAAVPRDEHDKPNAPVTIIGIRMVGSQVPWPGAAPVPAPPAVPAH